MGASMEYKIPGLLNISNDWAWERERQLERDARVARLIEAKEYIEAGIIPSDAEASDFFADLGADVEALSFQDMKLLDDMGALMTIAMFHYDREYSWDWLNKLTPELRRQVEIELGISVVNSWQEANNANEAAPKWPLYIATPPNHASIAPQSVTRAAADATDTYGVGTVMTGEVLPMRAEAGSPDTLDFSSDAFSRVLDDPWETLPPEQWTHRLADLNNLSSENVTEESEARG